MTKNLSNYTIKEIKDLLKVDEKTARKIKKIAREGIWHHNRYPLVDSSMHEFNKLLNGSGIEHAGDEYCNNFEGVDYVNMGDTYDTTIIYDLDQNKFGIGNWGNYVEYYDSKCKKRDDYY